MRTVVVTDLTRFTKPGNVCVAMIDIDNGECLRPLPYFTSELCRKHNIQPGAIFKGNFTLKNDAEAPHSEDANYSELKFHGPIDSKEFQRVLDSSLSESISKGFNVEFAERQKHIPINENVVHSIITIKVDPSKLRIHEDNYKPGKIKITFTDSDGHLYSYLAITDRGFYDFAQKHQNDGELHKLQRLITTQNEVYLRIGLSRSHEVGDRNGYWLQVNGIYTFPEYLEEIRAY